MQFVNEQNNIFGAPNFVHHRFNAFFKLSAIFCAGNHQRQVQRDDTLGQQNFWHIALDDFLREAFDDGGFTNARFAEQNRIIFRATAENLDDALDFARTTDDRIHVALARDFCEVAAKRF